MLTIFPLHLWGRLILPGNYHFIFFLWFCRFSPNKSLQNLFVFVFFSGLDAAGHFLYKHHLPYPFEHIDNWNPLFQYSSNTTLLYWVPQHFIVGIILTGLIIYSCYFKKKYHSAIFFLSLAVLWSPFVLIGLVPFVVGSFRKRDLGRWLTFQNIFIPAVQMVIVGTYLLSNESLNEQNKLLLTLLQENKQQVILAIATLILFEVILIGLIIGIDKITYSNRNISIKWMNFTNEWKRLFIIAVSVLALLPFIKFGANNDLVMRASIPALLVLGYLMAIRLSKGNFIFFSLLIALFLFLAAIGPINEITRSIKLYGSWEETTSIINFSDKNIKNLYIGNPSSFFFRYFAKREYN